MHGGAAILTARFANKGLPSHRDIEAVVGSMIRIIPSQHCAIGQQMRKPNCRNTSESKEGLIGKHLGAGYS